MTYHSNKYKLFKIIKGYPSKDLVFLSVGIKRGYIKKGGVVYLGRHLSMILLTEIYYNIVLQGALNLQQSSKFSEGLQIQLAIKADSLASFSLECRSVGTHILNVTSQASRLGFTLFKKTRVGMKSQWSLGEVLVPIQPGLKALQQV